MTLTSLTLREGDSVNPDALPPGLDVYGGYADGIYKDAAAIRARFPRAHILTFAVHATDRARFLDVEAGNASVSQAAGWYRDHRDTTDGPAGFYWSASVTAAGVAELAGAGIFRSDYLILSAHYGVGAHICGPRTCGYPQADGTQWDDHGPHGENYDRGLLSDAFYPKPTPPAGPSGIAGAKVTLNLADGQWTVTPLAGHVTFDEKHHRAAAAELSMDTHTGQWAIKPLPWLARIL